MALPRVGKCAQFFSRSPNMDHRDMKASEHSPKAERELRERAMELISF